MLEREEKNILPDKKVDVMDLEKYLQIFRNAPDYQRITYNTLWPKHYNKYAVAALNKLGVQPRLDDIGFVKFVPGIKTKEEFLELTCVPLLGTPGETCLFSSSDHRWHDWYQLSSFRLYHKIRLLTAAEGNNIPNEQQSALLQNDWWKEVERQSVGKEGLALNKNFTDYRERCASPYPSTDMRCDYTRTDNPHLNDTNILRNDIMVGRNELVGVTYAVRSFRLAKILRNKPGLLHGID